ncbi:MAG: hypothetical protein A2284_10135 [Deltaproteobacteria bacterium RIFOXYA12_FULL_61_11]|nr:MAG: hypothetical protein A2284_10135 [Deltaproteobacteria bacterium RIFOXYA12_FULL_61_11]
MAWEYSEKTKQLFLDAISAKPGTHLGEIEDPDGLGEHGSIVCGDAMRFAFRVKRAADPHDDRIVEARYLTFGCTSAIASSEALCTIIEERNLTPIEALAITNQDIVDFLGGLPEQKIHCSVMGAEALESSVIDWAKRRGVPFEDLGPRIEAAAHEEGRIVCVCFNLTEPYLRKKIQEMNLRTVEEVRDALKAGGACGSCQFKAGGIQDLLDELWGKDETGIAARAGAAEKSPYQLYKEIEQTILQVIRPMLQRDRGDLEIIEIKDKKVYCRLKGACATCAGAGVTLKDGIERVLRDRVDPEIVVIDV